MYSAIPSRTDFITSGFILDFIGVATDKDNVYLKLKYTAPQESYISIFLQGSAPGFSYSRKGATKVGENTVIFKLNKESLKSYSAGLAVNLGERNFVFISKSLMDAIANTNK